MEDLGGLLEETHAGVSAVLTRFKPAWVLYESPILPTSGGRSVVGTTEQRRAQFAQGAHVEWMCLRIRDRALGLLGVSGWAVECREANVYDVKQALTGSKGADKDQMVAGALRLGVTLPETKVDGREDAADAVGAWLVGVRHYAKEFAPAWDRRVYSPKGGLL
jgi:hypothetical protein